MDSEPAAIIEQPLEQAPVDPLAAFLERHGVEMIADHEGQMVTVAEAIANCPPFARLAASMGETALTLMAPKMEEEQILEERIIEDPKAEGVSESSKAPENGKSEVTLTKAEEKQPEAKNKITAEADIEKTEMSATAPNAKSLSKTASDTINKVDPGSKTTSGRVQIPWQAAKTQINKPPQISTTSSEKSSGGSEPAVKIIPQKENMESRVDSRLQATTEAETFPIPQAQNKIEPDELKRPEAREDLTETLPLPFTEEEKPESGMAAEASPILLDFEYASSKESDERTSSPLEPDTSIEAVAPAPELSLPVEEAELAVSLITERIEQLEEERAEEVQLILEEISEKTEQTQTIGSDTQESLIKIDGDSEFETSAQTAAAEDLVEEVEGLFVRLLEKLEINYSPELVNCLATLAIKDDLPKLIDAEDEEVFADQGIGTHEVIKRLLASLNSIKDLVTQACLIGKSAIRLYQLNYA